MRPCPHAAESQSNDSNIPWMNQEQRGELSSVSGVPYNVLNGCTCNHKKIFCLNSPLQPLRWTWISHLSSHLSSQSLMFPSDSGDSDSGQRGNTRTTGLWFRELTRWVLCCAMIPELLESWLCVWCVTGDSLRMGRGANCSWIGPEIPLSSQIFRGEWRSLPTSVDEQYQQTLSISLHLLWFSSQQQLNVTRAGGNNGCIERLGTEIDMKNIFF